MRTLLEKKVFLAAAHAAAGAVLLLLSGACASSNVGRLIDARVPRERGGGVSRVDTFGPFYEHVEMSDGASRTSIRPLLHTSIHVPSEDVRLREVVWPLYADHSRGSHFNWRFIVWGGTDFDTEDPEGRFSLFLFPFFLERPAKGAPREAALFPIAGSLPTFLLFDRIEFLLFPLWMKTERQGAVGRHYLWPFVSTVEGRVQGWRVWPFAGHVSEPGKADRRFVMWPFWSQATYESGPLKGTEWVLFPFYGEAERTNETVRYYLPPFFQFVNGRNRNEGQRRWLCPWPLVRIEDSASGSRREFLPFYASRTGEESQTTHVAWPVYKATRQRTGSIRRAEWSVAPFFHRAVVRLAPSGDEDKDRAAAAAVPESTYTRVWPLASHFEQDGVSLLRVPDLSFQRRSGALERNLLGMFTFFTRGVDSESKRSENELFWGLLGWGRDESGFHLSRLFWFSL